MVDTDTEPRNDAIAWSFGLAGLFVGGVDLLAVAALGFEDAERAQALWFTPRLLLGLPLIAACTAWLGAALRGPAQARFGRRGAWFVDLVCAAPLLSRIPPLVSGAAISQSPLRWPLAMLCTCVVLGALVTLRALAVRAAGYAHQPATMRRTSVVSFVVMVTLIASASWLTARTFHRLYPAFHQAITLSLIYACAACLFPGLSAAPARRRFRPRLAVTAAVIVWIASGVLTFPAAAGRRVLAESAPFVSPFVPAAFRLDMAQMSLITPPPPRARTSGRSTKPTLAEVRFSGDAPRPSILLVTVDALRADVLQPASRYAVATPGLRRIAERSLFFERAYAGSNGTEHALPPLLTGHPAAHGGTPAAEFLPFVLAEDRYDTVAWVTNSHHQRSELVQLRALGYHFRGFSTRYADAGEVVPWVVTMLDAHDPIFIWVHLSDVHAPFMLARPTVPGRPAQTDEYTQRLAFVDHVLTPLLDSLRNRSRFVWVLTADHGEAQGEHGNTFGHASSMYEEQIRVPLMMGGTGVPVARVAEPVSAMDVATTLALLAGAELPGKMTVLPPFLPQRRRGPVLARTPSSCALISGHDKLIVDSDAHTLALFDLANDPGELRNASSERPALARTLLGELREAGCRADLSVLEASIDH